MYNNREEDCFSLMLNYGFLWERECDDCTFPRVIVPMAMRDAIKCERSTESEKRGKLGATSRSREKESPESNKKQIHSQTNKQTQSEDCVEA